MASIGYGTLPYTGPLLSYILLNWISMLNPDVAPALRAVSSKDLNLLFPSEVISLPQKHQYKEILTRTQARFSLTNELSQ
jgi:hypothetical protein